MSAKTTPAKHAKPTRMKTRKKRAEAASASDGLPDFGDYGTGMLEQRLKKLLAHAQGAQSGGDTNAIHQMRVWSRRTRAALDVFEDCFTGHAGDTLACMKREVKNVTRALGEARDLDVMIETLRVRAESLPPEQRAGVESFAARLHAQRDERQQAVTGAVKRLESSDLKQLLHRAARKQGFKAVTPDAPDADTDAHSPSSHADASHSGKPDTTPDAPAPTAPLPIASAPPHADTSEQKSGGQQKPEQKNHAQENSVQKNSAQKNSERNHHG